MICFGIWNSIKVLPQEDYLTSSISYEFLSKRPSHLEMVLWIGKNAPKEITP
ncbi:hypothetical protein Scep_000786 [Stephania cephalantha]|uniref:Uncharacterized protein n=1 Tax=Stephania cephalantha TaxID=152367 RepID=A0AAP0Q382_9MAGN